jgi:hypothetical protein
MFHNLWSTVATAVTTKDSFWFLQAKDFVTLGLSLVAFFVAYSSLRITSLKPPSVVPSLGSQIQLAIAGPKGSKHISIVADLILYNFGAQAAVVDDIRLHLFKRKWILFYKRVAAFHWRFIVKTQDIADPGTKRRIWTGIEARAMPISVSRYDSIVKEVQFFSNGYVPTAGTYYVTIDCVLLNTRRKLRTRRIRRYKSERVEVALTEDNLTYLVNETFLDQNGIRERSLALGRSDKRRFWNMY